MTDPATIGSFLVVLGGTSLLAVAARWFRRTDELPTLESWALAGRGLGAPITWFLLGGTIFTAYTFAAMPGVVYGVGALGFFSLPYTIIVCPLAFVLLPKLWAAVREHGCVTVADWVKVRHGSPGLALAVALTGILATMPYIALQLIGIRAVLEAGGLYPDGWVGDLALVAVFAVLAVATYRHGLRAPTVISLVKGGAIFGAAIAVATVVLDRWDGMQGVFASAESHMSGQASLTLAPSQFVPFATLALGSAMALLMYPHVLTASFASAGPDTLRRVSIALPVWTALLGLFGMLGVAALAVAIGVPRGNAEAAVPMLVQQLMPAALTGVLFGAFALGALVPAAVMSIAAATLFVRNVYVEYLDPDATPKRQMRIAQWISLIAKIGAIAFVLGLRNQDAINLQLLGGVWILQTFPAVAIALFTRWLHHRALLIGWALGMACGTMMVVWGGFSPVVLVQAGQARAGVYAAILALGVNLAVAAALTPLLRRRLAEPARVPSFPAVVR